MTIYYWPESIKGDEVHCINCIYSWAGGEQCRLFPMVSFLISCTDLEIEGGVDVEKGSGAYPPACGQGIFVSGQGKDRKLITFKEWMERAWIHKELVEREEV